MKKITLLKSLLVAVMLTVGASAWATDILPSATVINPSVTEAAGSAATSWDVGQIVNTGTNGVKNTSGPMVIAKFDASAALSGKTLISANLTFDITPNPTGYNSSLRVFVIGTDWDASTAKWGNVTLTRDNPITDATEWTDKNGTKNCSYDVKSVLEADEDNVIGFLIGVNTGRTHTVSNLKLVIVTVDASSATTYTIEKYDASGTLITSITDIDGEIGQTVSAESEEGTFYSSDNSKKYVFDASNENNVVSMKLTSNAENNVLKLYFNVIGKYAYKLNAVDSDNNLLKELASGEQFIGDDATVYFNKAIFVNGKWYITTYTGNWVFHEATNQNILFTEDATISYFFEVEDINKSRDWAATGAYPDRYSNGKVGRLFKGAYAYTDALEGGVYTVTLWGRNQASSSDAAIGVYVRDTEGAETKCHNQFANWAAGGGQGEKTIMIEIPDGYSLELKNENADYNSNLEMDYLILRKSGINTMSIVGFTTIAGLNDAEKWNPAAGIAMTRDADDPAIWTAVVDSYTITGSNADELTYYYKAAANGTFDGYQLPASGNQNYNFNYAEAGSGTYKLTFTANTMANTVNLAIEKLELTFTVGYVDNDGWGNLHAYTYNSETLGGWPGTAMTEAGEVNGKKIYTISFDAYNAPANIIFNNGDNGAQTGNLDFVDNNLYGIAMPQVKVTDAGYATYCSPYALDFSNVSLTAYRAEVKSGAISFEEVTKVPAGEGVLVKGDEGTYDVQAIVNADAIENEFVGALESKEIATGSFVLLKGDKGVGFYKTKNAFTVGANTAYLPAISTARSFISLDGDSDVATGIESVKRQTVTNNEYYNLNGQRVAAPVKGLYIVNGKKIVVK